jgi:hypothetical protein
MIPAVHLPAMGMMGGGMTGGMKGGMTGGTLPTLPSGTDTTSGSSSGNAGGTQLADRQTILPALRHLLFPLQSPVHMKQHRHILMP